jgi:hypothetical protein
MGGFNSGRRWNRKLTTSEYGQLDVKEWQRRAFLQSGRSFFWPWCHVQVLHSFKVGDRPDRLILSNLLWTNGRAQPSEPKRIVSLEWTRCNYGGFRSWFLCPVPGCGRRVAILYCDGSSGNFACRHCHQISYRSQQETPRDRALHRAQAIRMRLGGSANLMEPFPWKPKGMHSRTYERLRLAATEAELCWIAQVSTSLALLPRSAFHLSRLREVKSRCRHADAGKHFN